ncbi:peptidylprolyl isomerase [Parasphingopyxis algicola]|uniref:peptidylprolyl isomerase n=1 Tax=Parasphingopyxis algicola TaxID=2026624 RepID=UPI0015A148A9|nr:peptidylprolyl isomerase [Parasphingopyxis algicola]QLC25219.1 peptidylprolyl isomerase [Parasphingopyxis algicola]
MARESYSFTCRYGAFTVRFDFEAAPETSAYFARAFATPDFVDASIFRIVTQANSSLHASVPIEVIQFGLEYDGTGPLDRIAHEGTDRTGLRHIRWAVSAARYGKGEAYPSCFICMRDEPELDSGGKRHDDGAGFAVFGRVTAGFETLERVFAQAESEDFLRETVPIELH